jgi:hypothetical protein
MSNLTLVYIAKDQAGLDFFSLRHFRFHGAPQVDVEYIGWANDAGSPLSKIANEMLDRCKSPVFGLCHADAVFGPGALDAFVAEAMRGAVCGIVGRTIEGLYRVSRRPMRDSWWDGKARMAGPGPVSTLDCMAVFFRRDLGLRFDEETFDGFHCHVEDLCLQAHARGIPVTVPLADAHHRNHTQSWAFLADYRRYRLKLTEKWAGTEFQTT